MDYIKEAIDYLINYDNLGKALTNLEMDIREIKCDLESGQIGAIEYSDMPKGDSSELPDDKLINKLYRLKVKKMEYCLTKKTLDKMNKALSGLSREDEKILRSWYVEGYRGETVLKHNNCSESTFYRNKNRAIRTFAIQLHGIAALK